MYYCKSRCINRTHPRRGCIGVIVNDKRQKLCRVRDTTVYEKPSIRLWILYKDFTFWVGFSFTIIKPLRGFTRHLYTNTHPRGVCIFVLKWSKLKPHPRRGCTGEIVNDRRQKLSRVRIQQCMRTKHPIMKSLKGFHGFGIEAYTIIKPLRGFTHNS